MEAGKGIVEHVAAVLTTFKATFAGLGLTFFTWFSRENVVWILTVAVLLCQLVSWGYRFWHWCKRKGWI